jgi:hypothetical protein
MVSLGFFHFLNPSGRTMALGPTQPLREMSTRNIFWGGVGVKGGRCVGLTTLPSSSADCPEIPRASTSPIPKGFVQSCKGAALPSYFPHFFFFCYHLNTGSGT